MQEEDCETVYDKRPWEFIIRLVLNTQNYFSLYPSVISLCIVWSAYGKKEKRFGETNIRGENDSIRVVVEITSILVRVEEKTEINYHHETDFSLFLIQIFLFSTLRMMMTMVMLS